MQRGCKQKRANGVGLAVEEEIVKEAGQDGIAVECTSARLMNVRISIISSFTLFVVAYALTEGAPEGQKAKYMAALNSAVAPVSTREYVFTLKDANARTEKRGQGGGEAASKVWGVIRPRRAQRNR